MSSSTPALERPGSVEEARELLRALGDAGRPLRVRGGGTKLGWNGRGTPPEVEVHTGELARVIEHNEGDFTAVLEAGVSLREAQERFAEAGQMLALDPPLAPEPGASSAATIGGVVASADSGPLRHRYGGARDLILGVTVVLSDGTAARAGGRVIKNVAGYDLGKLFTGSEGTLGLIAVVSVRLHPLAEETVTARASSPDIALLARAALRLAGLPLGAECLDVAWAGEGGEVMVRFAGAASSQQARKTAEKLSELGLEGAEAVGEDAELWQRQRERQRRPDGAVVKVASVISALPAVLSAAQASGAEVVSRAALGLSWVAFPPGDALAERVGQFRDMLPGAGLTVLDGADQIEDPRPVPPPAALRVMEGIKARFDPAHVFRPGALWGAL